MASALSRLTTFLLNIPTPYLTLLWLAGTTFLFLFPANEIPDPEVPSYHLDKIAHALLFAGLVLLLARDLFRIGWNKRQVLKCLLILLPVFLVYGWTMEYLQENFSNRDGNWPDLLADMIGVAIALLFLPKIKRKWPQLFA